jgi:hypothetical protein
MQYERRMIVMITRTLLVSKTDGTRKALEISTSRFRFFLYFEDGSAVPCGQNVGWRKAQDLVTLYLSMGKRIKAERLQDGNMHENVITREGVLVC